jgi:hypothetical protein
MDTDDDIVEVESIREQLELKRRELEMNLATVKRALNLIGGNDQAEEIFKAVTEALEV